MDAADLMVAQLLPQQFRMHGTEIIVRAGRAGGDRKFLISVQRRRFLELLIGPILIIDAIGGVVIGGIIHGWH
jgi:hypothetical protein